MKALQCGICTISQWEEVEQDFAAEEAPESEMFFLADRALPAVYVFPFSSPAEESVDTSDPLVNIITDPEETAALG